MKQDTAAFHSITAGVFIFKSNIAVSFITPSQIILPAFYFGHGIVVKGGAYKSWNKHQPTFLFVDQVSSATLPQLRREPTGVPLRESCRSLRQADV